MTGHGFFGLLEEIDEATEQEDWDRARQVIHSAEAHAADGLDRAMLRVRTAYVALEQDGGPVEDVLLEAIETFRTHGLPAEMARAFGALGRSRLARGEASGAVDSYEEAERIFAGLGDDSSVRRSRLNRAAALSAAGRHPEAEAALTGLAEELRSEQGAEARLLLAICLTNLGSAHMTLGNHSGAQEAFEGSARIYESLSMPGRAAGMWVNYAQLANRQGRPEAALSRYRRAGRLFREAGNDEGATFARRGEAITLGELGRFTLARQQLSEVMEHYRGCGLVLEQMRTAVALAKVMAEAGEAQDALALLKEWFTEEILTHPDAVAECAQALHNVGNLAAAHDPEEAAGAYAKSIELYHSRGLGAEAAERALALFPESYMGLAHAYARANLASYLLRRGTAGRSSGAGPADLDRAMGLALDALARMEEYRYGLGASDHRRHALESAAATVFTLAMDIAQAADDPDTLAAVIELSRIHGVPSADADFGASEEDPASFGLSFRLAPPRAVAARPGARPVGPPGPPVRIRDIAPDAVGEPFWWLNSWIDRGRVVTAAVGPARTIVHRAAADVDAHLAWLACLGAVYPLDLRIADGDEHVAMMLAGYRTAAGPLLADAGLTETYAGWLTTKQRRRIAGHPAVRLAQQAGESGLLWRLSRQFLPPELRDMLLGAMHAGQRKVLAVDPVPALGRLPWGLLPLAAPSSPQDLNVPRVLDAADIVYVPPAVFIASLNSAPPRRTGRGGTLLLTDSLGDLPATRYTMPGCRVLGGWWIADPARVATASRVLTELADGSPGVLIVAGHIRGADDPLDTALVLAPATSDGPQTELTARDLYRANSVPQVCMLLGCDSIGAAGGFEWIGLAQGLLWAGAHQVTGTLWPTLDDAVTAAVEQALIQDVVTDPLRGTWRHALRSLRAWRDAPAVPANRPYRWATYGLVGGRPR